MRVRHPLLTLAAWLTMAAAAQAQMPPLPAEISGTLRVGVRCDQPPFGFQDVSGAFAGVEVEMAKQMAVWALGSADKAEMTCVTANNRIPQLQAKKVDLLIATLGATAERARVVDFSSGYVWGGSSLLVLKGSKVASLADLPGHTVVLLKGTTQAAWFDANRPNQETLRLDSVSDALQALKGGRAEAMAGDRTTLLVIAARDPGVVLLADSFAVSESVAAVRKGDTAWLAWVDAALARMKAEKLFLPWIEKWVSPEIRPVFIEGFTTPRPKEG